MYAEYCGWWEKQKQEYEERKDEPAVSVKKLISELASMGYSKHKPNKGTVILGIRWKTEKEKQKGFEWQESEDERQESEDEKH